MDLNISNVANLPSRFGMFQIQSFKENDKEHLVIFKQPFVDIPLVRIHSECLTGDALGSLKCDCGEQLNNALQLINEQSGMVVYLRQEGRNIGLFNKINAYALQDKGLNTIEANLSLGFQEDERSYEVVEEILHYFGLTSIRLITNNPDKMKAFNQINVIERYPSMTPVNMYNENYLSVKKTLMGHLL
jgi:GTP cyclohydrolase II